MKNNKLMFRPKKGVPIGRNYTVWRLGMVELTNIFTLKNIIIYLLIINIIAFLAMFVGAIAGMYTFHHKTKKPRFFIGIPVIIVLQIMLIIALSIK